MSTESHAWRESRPNLILLNPKYSCQAQSGKKVPSGVRGERKWGGLGSAGDRIFAPAPAPSAAPILSAPARWVDNARAKHAARICELAQHLAPTDRAILQLAYADGKTIPQIAALIGAPRHATQRRLRRLTRRVLTPEFAFIAPQLGELDAVARAVARCCIIEGRSVRDAAAHLRTTQHAVRAARHTLLAMARAPNRRK